MLKMRFTMRLFGSALILLLPLFGCGSTPPRTYAKEAIPEASQLERPKALPQVSQELGSIDQRKVEQTFATLQTGWLEACHRHARERIEFLAGDVKVFLRIDGQGKTRSVYLEDSTLGDREVEKCILGVLTRTSWPKPEGGEAEVRSGFGWGPGGEREPASWSAENVMSALAAAKPVQKSVESCRKGVRGDFHVTAYVAIGEPNESAEEPHQAAGSDLRAIPKGGKLPSKGAPKPKSRPVLPGKSSTPAKLPVPQEPVGRFTAIGMAPPSKDGAEAIDCLIDALKPLELPSPGASPAKVMFSL